MFGDKEHNIFSLKILSLIPFFLCYCNERIKRTQSQQMRFAIAKTSLEKKHRTDIHKIKMQTAIAGNIIFYGYLYFYVVNKLSLCIESLKNLQSLSNPS